MSTFKCASCGNSKEAEEAPECCGAPMAPAEEAPAEEKPAEEAPAEEKPAEEKPEGGEGQ